MELSLPLLLVSNTAKKEKEDTQSFKLFKLIYFADACTYDNNVAILTILYNYMHS